MKPTRSRPASTPHDKRRARRARPTPRWLKQAQDLDEMAKRRTLMVLSVLSGERPVTDAIEEAQVSRPLYYQLETKALQAMLRALAPGAELTGTAGADGMARRISELEEQVKELTQQKRRSERLLFLTRKVVKKGPMAQENRGRPRKAKSSSTSSGAKSSTPSTTSPSSPLPEAAPSTSTKDGATTL
jgi:polyhydroxyalkanoate synthesis regulator phasin